MIQGIPVDILIDSGALNVSLISSAVVNYFSGSRKQIKCSLKGISDKEIAAREYITLTVEFSNITLEVDFVVVPASCMNTPIIIGTDVLNRVTVKDRYPLPLIDDHIDRLGGSKFFTSLDMASGFHQIPIDEDSIHRTGFVTTEAHYEYLKMPYGLCNSPTVYQRIINNTLRKFIVAGSVLVYIDVVLILSLTVDNGITLLREVLKTLTEAGFSINMRKCSFHTTKVEYLGRVISHGQVRPSPHKIEKP